MYSWKQLSECIVLVVLLWGWWEWNHWYLHEYKKLKYTFIMNHTWLLVAGANCKGISSKKALCFLISHKWPFVIFSHLLLLSEIRLVPCFTASHSFSHVYVSGLYILTSTYRLCQKVNVSYCISKYIEQGNLSTELRCSLPFGGVYSSYCNLGGCTDPVLLIHCVFAVYYLKLGIRSDPAKTPSLGLQKSQYEWYSMTRGQALWWESLWSQEQVF